MAHSLRAASLALLATLAALATSAAAAAQITVPTGRIGGQDTLDALTYRFRAEAGFAVGTPLVRDANGTRVATGASPLVGVAVSRALSSGTTMVAGVRVAMLSLRLRDEEGARWAGGTAWQVDAVAAAERNVLGCRAGETAGCTAARAGAGLSFLGGPRDLVPFRAGGSRWGMGGEAGVSARLLTARPLYVTALGHAYRMLGVSSVSAGTLRAGVVVRALVEVRYGR